MIITPTDLPGVLLLEPVLFEDDRGYFAVPYASSAFAATGLVPSFEQTAVVWNRLKGTLRGLHYQTDPHPQAKLVRCTRGSIFDVVVDVRPASATYLRWVAVELTPSPLRLLYVPAGFAHGYETLEDGTEVSYQIAGAYDPSCERGLLWDDPVLSVNWPVVPSHISARDRAFPRLTARTPVPECGP